MQFVLYPLRFEFLAKDSLFFPPGIAANILRGALRIAGGLDDFERTAFVVGQMA